MYLGKRYDVLMACIEHGGTFSLHVPRPMTLKGLADAGFLDIVEKRCTYPCRPYKYIVPEKVRQRYSKVLK
jgi:hypothetical protein